MVRVSIDPLDPGYCPGAASAYAVSLDRAELAAWITADEERCLVEVSSCDTWGEPLTDARGDLVTVRRRGIVVVRKRGAV